MIPTVCTILDPQERSRVDAAGHGYFAASHQDTVRAAIHTVRRRAVNAVLVSVHRCDPGALREIAFLVREFPSVPTVALLSHPDPSAGDALLRMGASGIRTAIDLRIPTGWERLRALVSHPASPVAARILASLVPALLHATPDAKLFFEALARLAPVVSTVRCLARRLELSPSTLMSRFFRAQVPSPKNYLARIRLVHAAHLFQTPGYSVADVAYRLDFSSPQSFGRHVRNYYGTTASEFRRRFPFPVALEHYVDVMITPYERRLRDFHPLNYGALDQGHSPRGSRGGSPYSELTIPPTVKP